MYSIRAEHGRLKYGVHDLVFDTDTDFTTFLKEAINPRIVPGSTAFIIASSKHYMLNNKSEWIEITVASSSSGGDGSSSEIDVDVDGGDITDTTSADTDINVNVDGGDI